MRDSYRNIQLAAANLNVKRAGLFQPLKVGRRKAYHRFTKSYDVWHEFLQDPMESTAND
jgi:hypothetical protein